MKQTAFVYRILADVKLTKGEVAQMMKVAESHYDGKCREFGEKTLKYWHNWKFPEGSDATAETEITVTWDEFDTIAKILEMERFHNVSLFADWVKIFQAVRNENERVNAARMMADKETYTESYRQTLAEKYGDGTAVIKPFSQA